MLFKIRNNGKRRKFIFFILSILLIVQRVGGAETVGRTKCTNSEEFRVKKYFHIQSELNLPLVLESSPRITHQMLTHIFKILIEELLGYANVTIITRNDNFNISNVINQFTEIKDNQLVCRNLSWTMINLEAWVPSGYDLTETTVSDCYSDCGDLRNPGYFGWFVPKETLKPVETYYRKGKVEYIYYGEFRNRDFSSIFDVTDPHLLRFVLNHSLTKDSGVCSDPSISCTNGMYVPEQCETSSCAMLLTTNYNETTFVIEHIKKLNLYVKVIWLGDNFDKVTQYLRAEYLKKSIKNSLLILSWYPSEHLLDVDNYIKVTFDLCKFNLNDHYFCCEYETRRIVKLARNELKTGDAKRILYAIHRTFLNENDYKTMINLYKNSTSKNYTDLACEWIKTNEDSWHNWTTRITGASSKEPIYIGGLFPYDPQSGSTSTAAKMAVDAINNNDTILENFKIELKQQNGNCSMETVMKAFIDYMKWSAFNQVAGVLGPACTETVEPLAAVSRQYRNLIISYSAEGADYSDRKKYPYFFRTIGENIQYKYVYLSLFKRLGWKRVAALTKDGQKYTQYITHLESLLADNNITFIANTKFPEDKEHSFIPRYLEGLKNKRARIIIADIFDEDARSTMCTAYKLEMTAKQGYIWFLPHWLNEGWYDTDKFDRNINCSTKEMLNAIDGYFTMTTAYFASNDSIMQENKTVQEWRESYGKLSHMQQSNYAGYVYDAVWTYAYALDKLLKNYPYAYNDFHTLEITSKLVEYVNETDFQGVSGEIKFRGGASRYSIIDIMQWRDRKFNLIGHFTPNFTLQKKEISNGRLYLNESLILWLTQDGIIPNDGTLPSPCALDGLANFLNVECYQAVIYLNIFVFSLLIIMVATGFWIMKRRYEKRVRLTEKYMKTLGIDLINGCKIADLDKWEVPRDYIILNRKIGEGAFGKVYGGEAYFDDKGWQAVAVKALKVGSSNSEQLDFLSEAEIMKRFDHKNIIQLLGVCTKEEPVFVIMEFMLYGDLKTFLLARRHLVNSRQSDDCEEISNRKLTSMVLDVARGLSYLAEKKYVHRDLASRNCLVNANRVVKIGDFGMTRPMLENDYYKFHRRGKLPVRWMAPESLCLGVFTPSSDVWSYGVLLYEVITFGSFPFQGMSNSEVLAYVLRGNTLPIPQGVKPQLEALLRSCWNKDKDQRPKASQIVEFLANNPRLISPCLDVPLSVQMEDTENMDLTLTSSPFRKPSTSFNIRSSMSNGINLDANPKISTINQESRLNERPLIDDSGCCLQMDTCSPREPLLTTSLAARLSFKSDSGFESNGHASSFL